MNSVEHGRNPMKIMFGIALVLAGWIMGPAAQQTPPANAPAHKVFVLTGCLEGGSGPTSAFKLTGTTAVGQVPSAPTDSSPTTAAAIKKDVYELQPTSSVSEQGINREGLQSHIGKRVEVTVRPIEVLSPAPSSSSSLSSATEPAKKAELSAPQRYTVTKINRLADSCA
jgi:hypothetical protein